jgi:hypothetical protein
VRILGACLLVLKKVDGMHSSLLMIELKDLAFACSSKWSSLHAAFVTVLVQPETVSPTQVEEGEKKLKTPFSFRLKK